MKEQKTKASVNEEFAVEFGDVNGIKLFELPYASKKSQKKTAVQHKK